jgi:hypothetical protein
MSTPINYALKTDATTLPAVEHATLIESGTVVTDDKIMDMGRGNRNHLMKTVCKTIVDGFPSHLFHPKSTKEVMITRLYQAKSDITGERLWDKFKDVRSDLQTTYKIAYDIPSGQ